ncbi:MAG: hypothetical protein BWY70_00828 [Bacteroidetes bacterium ADurb.Bin408]|nr:MAG: hypothetical protein BWY70_00828 [Bacteroidetes bacterium ADurb.Bin408]
MRNKTTSYFLLFTLLCALSITFYSPLCTLKRHYKPRNKKITLLNHKPSPKPAESYFNSSSMDNAYPEMTFRLPGNQGELILLTVNHKTTVWLSSSASHQGMNIRHFYLTLLQSNKEQQRVPKKITSRHFGFNLFFNSYNTGLLLISATTTSFNERCMKFYISPGHKPESPPPKTT